MNQLKKAIKNIELAIAAINSKIEILLNSAHSQTTTAVRLEHQIIKLQDIQQILKKEL